MITARIPARELCVGDFIYREGEATTVSDTLDGKVFARVGKKALLYAPDERVSIVIEDNEGRVR